jgi:hypothetical protein
VRTKVVFGRSLRSSEFRADSEDGAHLEFSGGAAVDFAPRRWLAEGLPEPADIPLDLVVQASLPDLSRFAWLFPTGSRVAGQVRGQARVVGTAALPLASGEVELSGGEWRLQDSLAGVTDLHGRMRIESGRATLEELAGEYGRGPIRIGGTIDWSTPGWPARIELQGERLLLARSDELRLRADADLVFEGPLGQATAERPHLRGTLRLRDGRYERRLDLLDSVRSAGRRRTISGPREVSLFSLGVEPLASAELDVRISGDPIEVDGNLVRARITPALVLQGTGRAPDLTGDLFVARGAVLVPAGIVEVRSGSISFTRAEPLVPQVNLLGQARLAGYDLTVRARGPYDDVDVLLTSSPSLSQSDLMRLLLSGRVPASGQGTEASRQTMQTLATFFGRDYLTRYLDEEFGSAGTSFLSRTEFQQGRDVTRSGGQTAEVSVRLSPGEEGERRSIYLRGENDVYDRTNFGLRIVFRFP